MSELRTIHPSNYRPFVWDVAVLGLPLVGLAPMLMLYAMQLWSKPETMLLPFCWFILILFVYYERKSISTSRWRVLLSYLSLAVALIVGMASVVYFSPRLANLALAMVFIGWALVRLVPARFSRILGLSMLTLVSLSLPFGLEETISARSNSLVVRLCSSVLDVFNVFHLYQFPYLALRDHYFEIAEILRNVFSYHTMVGIALVCSLIWNRPFLTTVLNIVSALVWTLLGKILLLFTTAVFSFNDVDVSTGFMGSLILAIVVLVFFLLMLASDAFWSAVLSPGRAGD